MKILGIDTSTFTGGAALLEDGQLIGDYVLGVEATHSERLLPAVERVMSDAGWHGQELDAVAVATGPGSFTGLRIGVTTAKALCYAWQLPVIGVSTLEAMAWQVAGLSCLVAPIINARRQRVYAGVYRVDQGGAELPQVHRAQANLPVQELLQELAAQGEAVAVIGEEGMFASLIEEHLGSLRVRLPAVANVLRPASVASLGALRFAQGERHDSFALVPAYIRKAEAEVKWEKQHRQSP